MGSERVPAVLGNLIDIDMSDLDPLAGYSRDPASQNAPHFDFNLLLFESHLSAPLLMLADLIVHRISASLNLDPAIGNYS